MKTRIDRTKQFFLTAYCMQFLIAFMGMTLMLFVSKLITHNIAIDTPFNLTTIVGIAIFILVVTSLETFVYFVSINLLSLIEPKDKKKLPR